MILTHELLHGKFVCASAGFRVDRSTGVRTGFPKLAVALARIPFESDRVDAVSFAAPEPFFELSLLLTRHLQLFDDSLLNTATFVIRVEFLPTRAPLPAFLSEQA